MRLNAVLVAAMMSGVMLCCASCATAPRSTDQAGFADDAQSATRWFENNVPGLRSQIDQSAGYIVFPSVGQWGILITGGQFGRGTLNRPDDSQIGWAAVNTGSIGLQAGVRGFRMLLVLEDEATLQRFMENRLTGSVSGVIVVAESGGSRTAPFQNGVAVYQGASTGLMAGMNIGLDWLRFQPLE